MKSRRTLLCGVCAVAIVATLGVGGCPQDTTTTPDPNSSTTDPNSTTGTPDTTPTADATAGQAKYDSICSACHSLGTYDEIGEIGPDLSGKSGLLVTDMSTVSPVMRGVTLTEQEILDVGAFLDAN